MSIYEEAKMFVADKEFMSLSESCGLYYTN